MQYLDVARPRNQPEIKRVVAAGIANHCPFCQGRVIDQPTSGTEVQILTGRRSGWIGTVAPKETWWASDEFCVSFEHDPPNILQRVLPSGDQFRLAPFCEPPKWLPSLSIDDLAFIDEAIIRFVAAFSQKERWNWIDEKLQVLSVMCWQRRLPIDGAEVWEVCKAHGMPQHFQRRFVDALNFGLGLLIISHGRPPIKRRRVNAMSIGRYQPDRRAQRRRLNEQANSDSKDF